jgi:hypothetical protein
LSSRRYINEGDYSAGWLAGEAEGIRLQYQSVLVNNLISGALMANEVNKQTNFDAIGENTLENTATSG